MYALTMEDTLAVAGGSPFGDTAEEAGTKMMQASKDYGPLMIAAGGSFGATAAAGLFAAGSTIYFAGALANHYDVGHGGGGGTGNPGGGGSQPPGGGSGGGGLQCSPGYSSWDNDHTVTYHPGSCTTTP